MTHGSLFSGIGGFDLAAQWAGIKNVWQCEKDEYCRRVLAKNFPEVKRYDDITTLRNPEAVDVISGGFPCQPFSFAGKRRGQKDDRYLWPEMLRVISEVRPAWVIGENVAGIVNMELDGVLSDLEAAGYTCEALIIPACAVDAKHRRDRVWIVGNTAGLGLQGGGDTRSSNGCREKNWCTVEFAGNGATNRTRFMADTERISKRPRLCKGEPSQERRGRLAESRKKHSVWRPEPGVGRVANGVPRRVDRLKSLGNAIVPQVAYQIFRAITLVEAERREQSA